MQIRRMVISFMMISGGIILSSLFTTVQADDLPDEAYINGIYGHPQSHTLSCEARSAADLAAFWGADVSEETLLASFPLSDDPTAVFVGNPDDPWGYVPPSSYGIHAPPVARSLRELGIKAEKQKNMEWDELRREISEGRPVIVWIIGQMWKGTPVTYTTENGKEVQVAAFEHTMIAIGYGPNQVNVIDAYTGVATVYDKTSFLTSWKVLGNMSITASGAADQTPLPLEDALEAYTVKEGEYLRLLANRYQTDWQGIAALNGIQYPYTLFPGQVIHIPVKQLILPTETTTPVGTILSPTATRTIRIAPVKTQTPAPTSTYTISPSMTPSLTATIRPTIQETFNVENPESYIVQQGDYLIALARRFQVNWRDLAALNRIPYPWIIHPGQILLIP
jgi:uncharacterized protein YvpB